MALPWNLSKVVSLSIAPYGVTTIPNTLATHVFVTQRAQREIMMDSSADLLIKTLPQAPTCKHLRA